MLKDFFFHKYILHLPAHIPIKSDFRLLTDPNPPLNSRFEAERGISGFRDTKSHMEAVEATASGLDVQKGQTLEDMSGMVHQLSMKIAERKSRLAPIIKELRPLRY